MKNSTQPGPDLTRGHYARPGLTLNFNRAAKGSWKWACFSLFLAILWCTQPIGIQAAPQGGSVIAGEAAISVNAAATVINQMTDKAIINWQGFSIDADELVRFVQPGAASAVLNRVTGAEPTSIFGDLLANGRVFLVNRNGILFGAGSTIDVAGLAATAFDIRDGDFLEGNYEFQQDPGQDPSYVINRGEITIAENGFAYLVAPSVGNEGLIVAELGQVVLGAGDRFSIDFNGDGMINFDVSGKLMDQITGPDGTPLTEAVSNRGTIQSGGGRVVLTGDAVQGVVSSVVNNTGLIEATSLFGSGGYVDLTGRGDGEVTNLGTIDVSAGEAGTETGTVALSGQYAGNFGTITARGAQGADGGDVRLDSSTQTLVSSDAIIDVSGSGDFSGGSIVLLSDGNTTVNGTLIARGGELGGNGGFVEVSSEGGMALNGSVDTSAPAGKTGTLLIDPKNVTIDAGGAATLDAVDAFSDNPSGDANINAATINAALAMVTVQANTDIIITSAIDIAAVGVALTLQAGRDVLINEDITTNNAAIDITANDPGAVSNRDSGTGDITMDSGTVIDATGGDITLTVQGSDPATAGAVTIDEITTDDGFSRGDVTIISYGAIEEVEASGDDEADITCDSLNLTVVGVDFMIGQEGNDLEIEAVSFAASTEDGSIVVKDLADGLAIGVVETGDGVGTVILEAVTGDITDGNGGARNITAYAVNLTTSGTMDPDVYGGAIGTSGTPIETEVEVLTATADDGGVFIAEADSIIINSVTSMDGRRIPFVNGDGNVVIDSSGTTGSHDVEVTADGDILLGTATAGNEVAITSTSGVILDGSDVTNIIANTVILTADSAREMEVEVDNEMVTRLAGAIGMDGGPIKCTAGAIDATTTDGGVFLKVTSGGGLDVVAGGTGHDIVVDNTSGDLDLGTVTAADGTVTIESQSGAVTDGNGATLNVTADSVSLITTTGVGSSSDPVETDTADLTTAASENNAVIYITETNGLDSVTVTTKDSDVEIGFTGGPLTFDDGTDELSLPSAPGLAVSFENTSGGIVQDGFDVGTADLTLTASGAIENKDGADPITAATATMTAGDNIGTVDDPVSTDVDELVLTADDGGIFVTEVNDVTLAAAASGTGNDVVVSNASGDITLNAVSADDTITLTTAGSLLDGNGDSANITAASAVLSADTAVGTDSDALETAVSSMDATSYAGGIYLANTGDIEELNVEATGGDIGITSSGGLTLGEILASGQTVTLSAGGDMADADDDDGSGDTVNIQSLAVNLTGRTVGASGNRIELAVDELVVAATGGGIYIYQPGAGDLQLTSASAAGTGADVEVTVNNNLALGWVTALGDRVVITSENGAVTDGNGSDVNVEARSLEIDAPGGIGTEEDTLELDVDFMSATGGSGGVAAANTGAIAVTADSLTGKGAVEIAIISDEITVLDNSGGTITMDSGGSLVLATTVGDIVFLNQEDTIDASGGGSITLQAGWGSDGCGAVIIAGNLITSGGGNITLQADYDITLCALDTTGGTGTIAGAGDVTVQSRNGILLDGNGADTNIFASQVTLSGYTPDEKDAEIAREEAIAEYWAKVSEAESKKTTWDTWVASNDVHDVMVTTAQNTEATRLTVKNTQQAEFERLEDIRVVYKVILTAARLAVDIAAIAVNVVKLVAGGAQAIPMTGDGGSAAVEAGLDLALSIAEIALSAAGIGYEIVAEDAEAADNVLQDYRAQYAAAKENRILATTLEQASSESSSIAEAAYNAAVIARDHSREVREQAILTEDTANVIGTTSQPLGIEAERVDILTFRTSSVYLESPGVLGLGSIDATAEGSDVIVTAAGDITVLGTVNSPDQVVIESTGGSVLDGDGLIVAPDLAITAATGVGLPPDAVQTTVERIAVDGGSGGVAIANDNGTTPLYITDLEGVSGISGDGDITISTTGDMNLESAIEDTSATHTATLTSTGGAIIDDNDAAVNLTASTLVASAVTGIELDTEIDDVTASTSGVGEIIIDEEDAVELTSITAADGPITVDAGGDITAVSVVSSTDSDDNDITLTATGSGDILVQTITAGGTDGDVTLTAAGAVDDDESNATLITGDALTITAPDGIGGTGGNTDRALDTTVNELTATVADAGEINIDEADDLDVLSASTADGNVTIISAAGSLNVTEISADTTDDTVTLIASAAITDAVADSEADNLTAANLAMTAGTGIGTEANPFETTVANLEASGGTGGIYVTDLDGGLVIGGVTPNLGNPALTGLQATGSGIAVTALSPLTIDEVVTNSGDGDITFTAGASDSDDDITVNADITSSGATGSITLSAADSIDQNADVSANGAGDITYTATDGGIDMAAATAATAQAGDVNFTAGTAVTLQADADIAVSTDGNIGLSAGTDLSLQQDAAVSITGSGDITMGAIAGDLSLGQDTAVSIGADGSVDLDAGGSVSQGQSADITVSGSGDVTIDADDGDITMAADSTTTVGVDGDIDLTASNTVAMGTDTVVSIAGDGNVAFTATDGDITMADRAGTTTNTGNVDYAAGTNITMSTDASVLVGTDGTITATAGGALSLGQNASISVAQAGNITTATTIGDTTMGQDANISVGTDGNIDINSGKGFAQGVSATVAVDGNGDITTDAADGDLTMAASSSTTVGGDGDIGYTASVNIDLGEDTVVDIAGTGDVVFTATAGSITLQDRASVTTNAGENIDDLTDGIWFAAGTDITLEQESNVSVDTDGNLYLKAVTGDITLELQANVSTDNDGTVYVEAIAGDITAGQETNISVGNEGDVTVVAWDGDVTTGTDANVSVGSDGSITLAAYGNLTQGLSSTVAVGGDGNIHVETGTGDIALAAEATTILSGDGDIEYLAGTSIDLGEDTVVDVDGTGSATGNDVTFTATAGAITQQDRSSVTTDAGDVTYSAGTDITLQTDASVAVDTAGDVTFGAIAGGIDLGTTSNISVGIDGNIDLNAALGISQGTSATISVGGDGNIAADAAAGDITMLDNSSTTIGGAGDIDLTAAETIALGTDTVVDIVGAGNATFTATAGDITMADRSSTTINEGNVSYTAGTDINLATDANVAIDTAGDVTFGAIAGDIGLGTTSNLSVGIDGNIDLDAALSISQGPSATIAVGGDGNVTADAAAGDITMLDSSSTTIGGAGDIDLTAAETIALGTDTVVDIVGTGNATFTATAGDITMADRSSTTTNEGNVSYTAGTDINLATDANVAIDTAGDVTFGAITGDIGLGTTSNLSVGTDGNIDLDAGLGISQGESATIAVVGDGNITADAAAGDITMLDSSTTTIGGAGDIGFTAAETIALGTDTVVDIVGAGNAIFTATAGDITMADRSSTTTNEGNVSYTAGTDINLATDANVAIDTAGDVTFGAITGDIGLGTTSNLSVGTDGNIDLDAALNISQGASATVSVVGDGNITADAAAGDIAMLDSSTTTIGGAGDIGFTAAETIALGTDTVVDIVGAGNVTFTATTGDITMADRSSTTCNEGNVTYTAGTGISLGADANVSIDTSGDIAFGAIAGDIVMGERATATVNGSDITYIAGGNITLQTEASISLGANGTIDLTAGGGITHGPSATVFITGNGDITADAVVGDITMEDSSSWTIIGDGSIGLTAGGNVIQGPNTTVMTNGVGDISVEAIGGDITMGADSSTVLTEGDVEYNAGGNIAVNEITTQSGNAVLGAIAGSITDINGAAPNITADDLNATAGSGIGEVGDALDTTVDTFTGTTTGQGPIVISETDGIELTSVTAADGLITVDAGGDIHAVSVVSTTDDDDNDITITATGGGNISIDAVNAGTTSGDVQLTADTGSGTVISNTPYGRVTGDVLTVTAVSEITLVTTGNSADMNVTGEGNLEVTEYDAMELTNVDTANGTIAVTAGGTITAADVESVTDDDSNDIVLTSTGGDVIVDLVLAGSGTAADVTIIANGAVTERTAADEAADITADNLAFDAGTGIGTGAGGAVDTAVATVTAVSAAGDINLDEADGVELVSVTAGNGDVTVNTERTGAGDTLVTSVEAVARDAGVSITSLQNGIITVVSIAADEEVALTAIGGAISDDNINTTIITNKNLVLTAPNGIGAAGDPATRALDTQVRDLTAIAAIAGEINIAEEDDLNVVMAAAADGDVTISCADGHLEVTSIFADTTDDTVTLIASGAITDAINTEDSNVTATDLAMTAGAGIGIAGNPLEVMVDNMEASGGSGGIHVTDLAGGLVIGDVTPGLGSPALTGLLVTGGDIVVTVLSPLTINENVTNLGLGNITLSAGSTSPLVDILRILANIIANGGTISLGAADGVDQNGNVSTSGSGGVNVSSEEGDVTMAPGTSTTVEQGNVSYEAGDNLAVNEITTATGGPGGNVTLAAPEGEIEDVNGDEPNITGNNIAVSTGAGPGNQADDADLGNDTGFMQDLLGPNVPNRIVINNRIMGGTEIESLDTVLYPLESIPDWLEDGAVGPTISSMWSMVLPGAIIDPAIDYWVESSLLTEQEL